MNLFDKAIQNEIKDIENRLQTNPDLLEKSVRDYIKLHPDQIKSVRLDYPEIVDSFIKDHPEYSDEYAVKCPTCGCPKVRRITDTEKLTSTVAFGFFSNKRRQQFECLNPNCGYRW